MNTLNYFDCSPTQAGELFVTACGFHKVGKNYREERAHFRFFGLEYVIRGQGMFISQGKRHPLRGGMVFCYGKEIPHTYYTDPLHPLEKLFVCYDGSLARELTQEHLGTTSGAVRLLRPRGVLTPMEELFRESSDKSARAREIAVQYLRIILMRIHSTRTQNNQARAAGMEKFLACKTYLDQHYEEVDSPFAAAAEVGISSFYMCHLFKRFERKTPHQYLTHLLLQKAAYLLVVSDASIKEIASGFRFRDAYGFSRAFKKHFGVSPDHYRRSLPNS